MKYLMDVVRIVLIYVLYSLYFARTDNARVLRRTLRAWNALVFDVLLEYIPYKRSLSCLERF